MYTRVHARSRASGNGKAADAAECRFPKNPLKILGAHNARDDVRVDRREKGVCTCVSIFGNLILSGSLLSDSRKWQLSARFTPGRDDTPINLLRRSRNREGHKFDLVRD